MARKLARKRVSKKERQRRKRISVALKRYHRTKVTARERKWGQKIAREQRKESKRIQKSIKATKGMSPKEKGIHFLEMLASKVEGDTSIDSATHADGSVEIELRIAIPRGEDGKDILLTLAPLMVLPSGFWMSIGWIFSKGAMSSEEIADYEKFHKGLQVHTHYRYMRKDKRGTPAHKRSSSVVGANRIYDALMKHKRRKPEMLYIRLHWSPTGERPE